VHSCWSASSLELCCPVSTHKTPVLTHATSVLATPAQEDRNQVLELVISHGLLDKRALFACNLLSQGIQKLVHYVVRRRLPDYLPIFLSPGRGSASNNCLSEHTRYGTRECLASAPVEWLCRIAGPGAASSAAAARAVLLDTRERAHPESIRAVIDIGAPCRSCPGLQAGLQNRT
jgi:hypothetical protein